jgi:hypothetical protein
MNSGSKYGTPTNGSGSFGLRASRSISVRGPTRTSPACKRGSAAESTRNRCDRLLAGNYPIASGERPTETSLSVLGLLWPPAWNDLVSLYATAEPPIFDIMLKVSGLPSNARPPGHDLRRELNKVDLSFGGLAKTIVADASEEDLEQARRDWRVIAGLIEEAEKVNWNSATAAWEARMKSLAGTAQDAPSIRARKAQRVRPTPPPNIIVLLRNLWHESVARAVMLATLIAFRRSPYFSEVISVILAGSASWFGGLPSREPARSEELVR